MAVKTKKQENSQFRQKKIKINKTETNNNLVGISYFDNLLGVELFRTQMTDLIF